LPTMLSLLKDQGMEISSQVRFNPELETYAKHGLYIPYREKDQAGLQLLDSTQETMYRSVTPNRVYESFDDIPAVMVQTLLFIEDRDLLSERYPKVNPVVDWGRFARAVMVQAGGRVGVHLPSMGGSTLATQTEKFRHTDNGITSSIRDKLLQMASASVRVYQNGEDTTAARKQLVLYYLNSVPLSAAPRYGEVSGIGDGLYVWYGTEFEKVNQLLSLKNPQGPEAELQARVIKQMVSMMIAQRRPSYYLKLGRNGLAALSNSYIRLLTTHGVLSQNISELAQAQPLFFRNFGVNSAALNIANNKGVNVVRNRLSSLLKKSLYGLDRMDLTVTTSLDNKLQVQVNQYLKSLRDPEIASSAGLIGKYLLTPEQIDDLSISFTLFERTPEGSLVRVQTDTTGLPFDINEGSKLELGSTAKLRTLVTYLEIIAELHAELSGLSPQELNKRIEERPDTLTRWACDQFLHHPRLQLQPLLEAAMLRRYSASSAVRFFTGGGLHVFNNFRKADNNRVATVTESLQYSINLPFIRIMQDIVHYTRAHQWENIRQILLDDRDPRRKAVLDRFIDKESKVFLSRFWHKYRGKTVEERLSTLLASISPNSLRLAVIHRHLFPEADSDTFILFIKKQMPGSSQTDKKLQTMYTKYQPGAYSLQDMGYLAAVHPLELWLLEYLRLPGQHSLKDAESKSAEVRNQVYSWLMRTKVKNRRDTRVRTILEIDAFSDIHRRWKNMGYPFNHLVPSLATALGSSGDRPAALSELIGIILNDGKLLPTYRITRVEFGKDTPYETTLEQSTPIIKQVLDPEVARILKTTLTKVVSEGTGRRLLNSFQDADGSPLIIGGKTGTGDNRIMNISPSGIKTSSRTLNRTATFVFFLGDNFFGTLTAFVNDRSANTFHFTSALPLQLLKGMAPVLQPYITGSGKPRE
jgi:membrane peptidoglycan carboxypeptidase